MPRVQDKDANMHFLHLDSLDALEASTYCPAPWLQRRCQPGTMLDRSSGWILALTSCMRAAHLHRTAAGLASHVAVGLCRLWDPADGRPMVPILHCTTRRLLDRLCPPPPRALAGGASVWHPRAAADLRRRQRAARRAAGAAQPAPPDWRDWRLRQPWLPTPACLPGWLASLQTFHSSPCTLPSSTGLLLPACLTLGDITLLYTAFTLLLLAMLLPAPPLAGG